MFQFTVKKKTTHNPVLPILT